MAREIKTYKDDELYAGTPPTEMLKVMLEGMAGGGERYGLMVSDVSRAYFYADVSDDIYIELPEDEKGAREGPSRDVGDGHVRDESGGAGVAEGGD